jgi:hypothetical protein
MKRRLFNLLAGMSLLLYLGACVLWLRGFWLCDVVGVQHAQLLGSYQSCHALELWSGLSRFSVDYEFQGFAVSDENADRNQKAAFTFNLGRNPPEPFRLWASVDWGRKPWERLGFQFQFANGHTLPGIRDVYCRVGAPAWFVLLLSAAAPADRLRRRRAATKRRRYILRGQCVACGYDCRATPNRCSECGMASKEIQISS